MKTKKDKKKRVSGNSVRETTARKKEPAGRSEKRGKDQILEKENRRLSRKLRALEEKFKTKSEELKRVRHDFAYARRIEQELTEREAQLKEAQHLASIGSWNFTVKTGILTWSEELYAMFSRDPRLPPLNSTKRVGFYAPESLALARRALRNAISTGEPYEIVVEMLRPDGTSWWGLARGWPIRDDKGRVSRIHGTFQDITIRKRAAERAEKHAADMEFLSRSSMGFIDLPPDKNVYQYIAQRLHDMLPEFRIIINEFDNETSLATIMAVEGVDNILSAVIKILGRDPVGLSTPLTRKDKAEMTTQRIMSGPTGIYEISGGVIPESVCAMLDRILDIGTIYGMGFARQENLYGNAVLISPKGQSLRNATVVEAFIKQAAVAVLRYKVEEALKESEKKYRELVENANSIILRMDTQGTITFFNEFAQKFFGFETSDIIGKNVIGTIVPEADSSGTNLSEMIKDISHKPEQYLNNENENIKKNGERVWISWTNKVIRDESENIKEILCIGNDATVRKLAEIGLRESERKYRELADFMPEIIFELDIGLNIVYINRIAYTMMGYNPGDLVRGGMNILDLFIPEDRDRCMANSQALINGSRSTGNEYTMLRSDGTRIPVVIYSRAIKLDGAITGIRGIIVDITDLKKAEEALRESEEKYRNIVEHITEMFFMHDLENRLLYVSPGTRDLIGYTPEEMVMKEWIFNITDSPLNLKAIENTKRAIETGEAQQPYLMEIEKKDGSIGLLEINESPYKDLTGAVVGMVGAAKDVTEQIRISAAFQESEEKFRSLFEDSGDAQFLMDGTKIIDCNSEAVKLMGCEDKTRLVQKYIHEISPSLQPNGEPSAKLCREYSESALKHRSVKFEWTHRKYDGTVFTAEVVLTAIPMKGKDILHANIRDITDRKQLQNEIINIIDIEQQRLGRNLHDGLGQDLTGVAFLCNALTKKLKELELPEASKSEEITEEVYRIITMVRNLSHELYPPNLVENEITYTLTDFALKTESLFKITCMFEHDPEILISDIFVSTQIYYIVREAVHNAIKHGNPKCIFIRLTTESDKVNLTVEDDGTGLADMDKKGKGLGLRIMAYRMESIHGTFGIIKNSSGGTTIFCVIPKYIVRQQDKAQ